MMRYVVVASRLLRVEAVAFIEPINYADVSRPAMMRLFSKLLRRLRQRRISCLKRQENVQDAFTQPRLKRCQMSTRKRR
jgi:hypothetical protein